MSYYLLDSVPNQMLDQQRELKDDKKDEQAQDQDQREEEEEDDEEGERGHTPQLICGSYHRVQLPVCDQTYDIDHEESYGKLCYSKQLAAEDHRITKCERIGEGQKLASKQSSSKPRLEKEVGDYVRVRGGRFIRKKERDNKVCTSKGPRDRRVRLSANTAIRFYDVQDRLGYGHASEAIDWLIEKAKVAIEALAELPAQNRNSFDTNHCEIQQEPVPRDKSLYQLQRCQECDYWPQKTSVESNSKYDMEDWQHLNNEGIFSMVSQFQDYPTEQNSTQAQDLYLHHSSPADFDEQALNSASSLTDLNSMNTGRFQSLMARNSSAGNEGAQLLFNSLPSLLQQPFLKENQFFSQWGPLQSSNQPIFVHDHANTESPSSLLHSSKGFSSGGFVGI